MFSESRERVQCEQMEMYKIPGKVLMLEAYLKPANYLWGFFCRKSQRLKAVYFCKKLHIDIWQGSRLSYGGGLLWLVYMKEYKSNETMNNFFIFT